MRFFSLLLLVIFLPACISAQTNTFPSSGNVGIGTLSPLYKLDVRGAFSAYAQFSSYVPDGLFGTGALPSGIITPSGEMRVRFGYLDQGGGQYWGRVGFVGNTNWSAGTYFGGNSFTIGRNYNGADLTITNAGNVGIGNDDPACKLDVSGVIRGYAQFSSHSPDGLFSAGAVPAGIRTPGGNLRIRFGYLDENGGQYWGRIGFQANNNWSLGTAKGGYGFGIGRGNDNADLLIDSAGNVKIGGEVSGNYKLSVNGDIKTRKLVVSQQNWSDFVFEKNYKLPGLAEVESFIAVNKHLPGIPSAKEVAANGVNVGETQALLLQKIEELTLYLIEIKKENAQMRKEIEGFKKRIGK